MTAHTKRQFGSSMTDNLALAAGFGADRVEQLKRYLDEWMEDHHPSVHRRRYFLLLLSKEEGRHIFRVHRPGFPVDEFPLRVRIEARFGAFAPFLGSGKRYRDMQTVSSPLGAVGTHAQQASSEGAARAFELDECVEDPDRFNDICDREYGSGRVAVVYHMPTSQEIVWVALAGGSGWLEPYPSDRSIRARVHKRNLAVIKNCTFAYGVYIKQYVLKINAAADEVALRKVGPPSAPAMFPRPAGSDDREYAALQAAGVSEPDAFDAWQAIRQKLDLFWNQRSMGCGWIKCDLAFDTAEGAIVEGMGQKFGIQGNIKLNFEADSDGRISTGTERELTVRLAAVNLKLDPETGALQDLGVEAAQDGEDDGKKDWKLSSTGDTDGNTTLGGGYGKASGSITLDKDRLLTRFNVKLGPYAFGLSQDGTCTVGANWVTAKGNVNTGQVSLSGDYSFHDFLKQHGPKDENGKSPPWVERCPDVKLSWEVGIQLGPHQSDIMRVVAGTPGLWAQRPRAEFRKLAWSSLDPDEQGRLAVLGFDQHDWDFKILPDSTSKDWTQLTAEQKLATLYLPIPAADPYWQKFWKELQEETSPVGDLLVRVVRGGSPVASEPVRALKDGAAAACMGKTGAAGEAAFKGLACGKYKLFAGEEGSEAGGRVPCTAEVKRGEQTSVTLTLAAAAGARSQPAAAR